ncbi:uncharacterized protein L969DRAFT_611493 [Mixia osmundae IAM 14324]|uniref:Trafficking protein particle complex subunit n=1 Tax=Mixia osmundae (strain CBS 9802 / IAM 14324 / JCM 22182 / KY 12970) TaxID=764103 RepID=G7E2J2_MIXOS|nr:uncharacterized protein L969DRAFT_611493 [Mixia osmundae IAM 14324]KEI36924.1 hypothetical protein L969DRAFT_611493 [Mixia osmundae IAM 14324]GAA97052.1 hypothetical protein E5Q_03727 [Mixia osmundae IAM 14324]
MTIYSLFIYDRHCECVYFHDFREKPTSYRPGASTLPGVCPAFDAPPLRAQDDSIVLDRASVASITAPVSRRDLPFDEEAKLVYGVVFSLRNMVKKLAGREEAFLSYSTSTYKLHFFETVTGYKFLLLSDLSAPGSLRHVLKQIYQGAFIEFVVRNPLIQMDSHQSGRGIDNVAFRRAVGQFIATIST